MIYNHEHRAKLRPEVLKSQGNRCLRCKTPNRKIGAIRPRDLLELAHLDGNVKNTKRENLAGLCIACHKAVDYQAWARKCWETRTARKDRNRPLLQEAS